MNVNATQRIGPVDFLCSTPIDATREIVSLAHEGRAGHIHLANAYTIALAHKSIPYRTVLGLPAVNLPDGKPVAWASTLKRQSPRLRQVRGPQLFLDVFDRGREHGIRHFLLGSTPDTLAKLEANLQLKFPGVKIVGTESPAFRPLEVDEMNAQDLRIRDSGAQIVWVGLGTPKQDFEAARLATSLQILAIAVGAAFDFAAGTTKQAPEWMTRMGLEWVFRFASEPRRLWKRYVFGNARFVWAAFLPKAWGNR